MPSIKEKLKFEERNERTVRLWPEGAFYKAYERSAYLFVSQIRQYELRRRYVDAVGQDVVSTGFPQSVLSKLGVSASDDDGVKTIRMDTPIDEQQYLLWRDAVPLSTAQPKVAPQSAPQLASVPEPAKPQEPLIEGAEQEVVSRIRDFNLASATPLDCMLLLSELQKMLADEQG